MRLLYLSCAIMLLNSVSVFAQLLEVPLDYNKALAKAAKSPKNDAQQRLTTLTLPFIDDFSYNGVYPTPELWLNNQAWVNRGMGKKPPTVGVATLDGLKPNGLPYSWTAAAGSSLDTLLSRPIDLSSYSGGDSIYLSFFYQPGGNGDMPETADKLWIDFKNSAGTWVNQVSFTGQAGVAPDFKQVNIAIKTATFLHNNFQFRFRNSGNARGARDHWHIDYVKIATNRRWSEPFFNDVAFFAPPISPFLNYTAMPYTHFRAVQPSAIMSPNVVFKVWNHFNTAASPNLSLVVDEQYSNTTILPQQTPVLLPIGQGIDETFTPNIAVSNYNFAALPQNTDTALLRVRYLFTNITGQDNLLSQTSFPLVNDTVTLNVPLRDYFAYDDGSAETALITQSIGTRAAIKFRALVGDTLQGVQLHVPAFDNNVQSQRFDFEIYLNDLNGQPIFRQTDLAPYYGDSLQYWTSYPFFDNGNPLPPYIPANTDFYVVWRQASVAYPVPIGLDKNTPENAQFIFQNTGSGWSPIGSNVQGALMMRPYMGNKRFVSNNAQQNRSSMLLSVFPNPAHSSLHIRFDDDHAKYNYAIINSLGQNLQTGILSPDITVADLPQGVYFLQITPNQANHLQDIPMIRFIKN